MLAVRAFHVELAQATSGPTLCSLTIHQQHCIPSQLHRFIMAEDNTVTIRDDHEPPFNYKRTDRWRWAKTNPPRSPSGGSFAGKVVLVTGGGPLQFHALNAATFFFERGAAQIIITACAKNDAESMKTSILKQPVQRQDGTSIHTLGTDLRNMDQAAVEAFITQLEALIPDEGLDIALLHEGTIYKTLEKDTVTQERKAMGLRVSSTAM